MPAEASHKERMLFYRLDGEVIDLSHMADSLNELGKLAKRDSSTVTTVSDHRCKGVAVCGVRTERDLSQRW